MESQPEIFDPPPGAKWQHDSRFPHGFSGVRAPRAPDVKFLPQEWYSTIFCIKHNNICMGNLYLRPLSAELEPGFEVSNDFTSKMTVKRIFAIVRQFKDLRTVPHIKRCGVLSIKMNGITAGNFWSAPGGKMTTWLQISTWVFWSQGSTGPRCEIFASGIVQHHYLYSNWQSMYEELVSQVVICRAGAWIRVFQYIY